MSSWLIIIAGVVVAFWIWAAYAAGRNFGKQEQFLIDMKRQNEEYRQEILQRQKEIEEDWANAWDKTPEEAQGTVQNPVPDSPVPSSVQSIRKVNNA